jgi:hypothetical protein
MVWGTKRSPSESILSRLIGVVPELNRERGAASAKRVTARSERLYEIRVDL